MSDPEAIFERAEAIMAKALADAGGDPMAAMTALEIPPEVQDLLVMDFGSETLALHQTALWAAEKEEKNPV